MHAAAQKTALETEGLMVDKSEEEDSEEEMEEDSIRRASSTLDVPVTVPDFL
jgi:hypothetical protein